MALQLPKFDRISFDDANPALVGAERGQKLMQQFMSYPLELQKQIVAARYAEPMAKQGLTKAIQENQWNPQIWQSEIGLRGAQSGLANSETSKNQFLVKNPQYISAPGMLIQQAMEQQARQQAAQQGQGQRQPQGQPQGQPPQGMGGEGQAPTAQGQGQPPSQGGQYSPNQYHPDVLAYNPPTLQSPTGNQNLDPFYYKTFGMQPIQQAQIDLAQNQAKIYQHENEDRNKVFANESVVANQSTIAAHKFLEALERSSALERGAIPGGFKALSDEAQNMDTYANQMATSGTQLFAGDKAIHDSFIDLQQSGKPGRKLNKAVAFDLAHDVIAKNDRMKERQQFYATGTDVLHLKPTILDAMWNKYETERPYIDSQTKMPNDSYAGTWKDYLNPEAVNAYKNGQDYNFPNQRQLKESNWNAKDLKEIKSWAHSNKLDPKMFTKENLYKTAQKRGMTLSQLKIELIKKGVL